MRKIQAFIRQRSQGLGKRKIRRKWNNVHTPRKINKYPVKCQPELNKRHTPLYNVGDHSRNKRITRVHKREWL